MYLNKKSSNYPNWRKNILLWKISLMFNLSLVGKSIISYLQNGAYNIIKVVKMEIIRWI